jgi:hypothetical protein
MKDEPMKDELTLKDRLLNAVNLLLTIDFFFILASFLWFVVGVLGRSFNVALGFDLWHRLWEPLFQPAIGLLMAGALISGLSSWVTQKFQKN